MFSDPPLTKRQLGWLFCLSGVGLALATFGIDLIGAGQFGGLGPLQQKVLMGAGALVLFGCTLLPLGHRLA